MHYTAHELGAGESGGWEGEVMRLAGVLSPVYVFVCVFCVVFLKISGFDVGCDDKIALSTKSNAYHGSVGE